MIEIAAKERRPAASFHRNGLKPWSRRIAISPKTTGIWFAEGSSYATDEQCRQMLHLKEAIRYIEENRIPGRHSRVRCLARGSVMVAARSLLAIGCRARDLCLYDTFDGMSAPRGKMSRSVWPAATYNTFLRKKYERRSDLVRFTAAGRGQSKSAL